MTAGAQGERHNKEVTAGGFGLTTTNNIQKAIFFLGWAGNRPGLPLCCYVCTKSIDSYTLLIKIY